MSVKNRHHLRKDLLHLFFSSIALMALLDPGNLRGADDLYVGDRSGTIFKFTPAGTKSTFAPGVNNPSGLAFDKNGNLFVADSAVSMLFKFTPAGVRSTFASNVSSATGLAFDAAGNLYVGANNGIFKFTPNGIRTTFVPFSNPPGLQESPPGLAFDGAGNLLVSFPMGSTVLKYTPGGTRTIFGDGLGAPMGLAFDASGHLFVADFFGGRILKFDSFGNWSEFATGLNGPTGLAFDRAGNLFVAIEVSGTILKFTPTGTKSTFASALNQPIGLAFNPVTEKLRNISARGFVSTGDNVLIGGFVLGGNGLNSNGLIVRAIGPSLSQAGISNPLQDPTLELHDSSGALIATNDNWQTTQRAQIVATGLAPKDARESAIYAMLPAGPFTAIVRGKNNATGTALVEVYSITTAP